MSASTEELLQQIVLLETKLQDEKLLGKPTLETEEQLFQLRNMLAMMNENLNNSKNILKG